MLSDLENKIKNMEVDLANLKSELIAKKQEEVDRRINMNIINCLYGIVDDLRKHNIVLHSYGSYSKDSYDTKVHYIEFYTEKYGKVYIGNTNSNIMEQ